MATHSSILAWRISMDRGAWQTTVHRVTESDTTECVRAHNKHTVSRVAFSLAGTTRHMES